MSFIREYNCPHCNVNFDVIHKDEEGRNTHCCYCGTSVRETGVTKVVEEGFVVVRNNGRELERYKVRNHPKEHQ